MNIKHDSRGATHLKSSTDSKTALFLLVVLLLLASLIHFHGFVGSLPYHLNPDEPNIWLRVNFINRTGGLDSTYPPLRLLALAAEFWLLNLISPGEASQTAQFVVGRVSTISYTLLLLAVTYQAGKQLHSRAAGIAAAIYLLAQPQVLDLGHIFKTDNFAWFWGMTCLMLVLAAIRTGRRALVFGSLAAGIAACLSKYTMLPVLAAPVVLIATLLPRNSLERRTILGLGAVMMVGVGAILVNPNGILLQLSPSHRYVLESLYTRGGVLRFVSFGQILPSLLGSLGILYLSITVFGLLLAPVLGRRPVTSSGDFLRIAVLMLPVLATYMMMALLPISLQRAYDRMVIVLCFAIVFGMSTAILVRRHIMVAAVAAMLVLAPWIGNAWETKSVMRNPDTRALTANWFIEHVPEGVHVAAEYDRVEFDAAYGGYPSSKVYFLETLDSKEDYLIDALSMRGFEYVIADYRAETRGGLFDADADHDEFLSQLEVALDLTDPNSRGWQGPDRIIYRIPQPQDVPMHIFLGNEIIFKGYDLPSTKFSQGDVIPLVLYWAALRATEHDYMVYAHVYSADNTIVAQLDGPPGDAAHRTFQWTPGYFDSDEWFIELPDSIPAGIYTLRVGMYDRDTQIRLQATDADGTVLGDSIILADIEVKVPSNR